MTSAPSRSKAFPQAIVPTGDNPNNPNNFSYKKLSDSYDVVRADVAKDNANNANNFSYEKSCLATIVFACPSATISPTVVA